MGEVAYAEGRLTPVRLAAYEMVRGDRARTLKLLGVVKASREWYGSTMADPAFAPLRAELKAREA